MRTGEFCRKIELQLGLSIAPQMHILKRGENEVSISESDLANHLRKSIDEALMISEDLVVLKSELKKRKIKMQVGRGISFMIEGKGVVFKGSKLGREYSLLNLEQRIITRKEMKKVVPKVQQIYKAPIITEEEQIRKSKQFKIR
jgi:hypothetical protein